MKGCYLKKNIVTKPCPRMLAMSVALILTLLSASFLSGCTQSQDDQGRIDVIVSILPQKEMVEAIGGDSVNVTVMIPPGASPATYDPTPSKLRAVSRADVYLMQGELPFEKAYRNRLEDVNPSMRIVDTSRNVRYITSESGRKDPHVWLSPTNMRYQAKTVADTLSQLDVTGSTEYRERYEAYAKRLDTLDRNISQRFSELNQTTFIAFHPAWAYLAKEYGLTQVAIQHEGNDPTPRQLQGIIETARNRSVKVIVVQAQFSRQHAEQIAKRKHGRHDEEVSRCPQRISIS